MLKKIFGVTLLLASISVSAFAAIPRDQMHIGGLKPGMTMQQVAAIYGMPQKVNSPSKGAIGLYDIAGGLISGRIDSNTNTFAEYCINEEKPGADRIVTTGNIHLGMTVAEVERVLGKPDIMGGYGQNLSCFYYSVEHGVSTREHDSLNLFFRNGRLSSFSINMV